MRAVLLMLILLLSSIMLLSCMGLGNVRGLGVGQFDLSVSAKSEKPIRAIFRQVYYDRAYALMSLETMAGRGIWPAAYDKMIVREPFTDGPIELGVPTESVHDVYDRLLQLWWFPHLVVVAEFKDGKRAGKLIDIPDPRESTEITVTLP